MKQIENDSTIKKNFKIRTYFLMLSMSLLIAIIGLIPTLSNFYKLPIMILSLLIQYVMLKSFVDDYYGIN